MQGGRDHLSHRLVSLGLSERQAVVSLYVVCALAGALAVASNFLDMWATVALAALLILGVGLFGAFLADVRMYPEERYRRAQTAGEVSGRPSVSGIRLYKRQAAEVLLDLLLACLAYLTAYLLKFEASFAHEALTQFAASLPYVIAAKMVALVGLGVYRPVWRYAGTKDLMRIALASAVGTVLAAAMVMLLFGFRGYSRSVFVIDWFVLTALLGGVRLFFPVLADIIGTIARSGSRRVLIVGANDLGEMILRAMLRDPSRTYLPVGFLDDDPGKHRRQIHGIPILGATANLSDIVRSRDVEEVVLASPGGTGTLSETVEQCIALGVPYRDAASFLSLSLVPATDHP